MTQEEMFRQVNAAAGKDGGTAYATQFRALMGTDPRPLDSADPGQRDEADRILEEIEARYGGPRTISVDIPGIGTPFVFRVLTDAAEVNAYERYAKAYPQAVKVHPDEEIRSLAAPLDQGELAVVGVMAYLVVSPAFTEKHFLRLARRAAGALVKVGTLVMKAQAELMDETLNEGLERGKDGSGINPGSDSPTPPPSSAMAGVGASLAGASA